MISLHCYPGTHGTRKGRHQLCTMFPARGRLRFLNVGSNRPDLSSSLPTHRSTDVAARSTLRLKCTCSLAYLSGSVRNFDWFTLARRVSTLASDRKPSGSPSRYTVVLPSSVPKVAERFPLIPGYRMLVFVIPLMRGQ
jgi:hypothetical protein